MRSPRLMMQISYLTLRRSIGVIGVALPVVLAVGCAVLAGHFFMPSLSDYYFTPMRDYFVGSLCAIGVFLFSYRGYDTRDDAVGNVAALSALGVALFPAAPEVDPTATQTLVSYLHYTSSVLFLATLAYFCLFLFTKNDPLSPITPQKKKRNRLYRLCGVTILASLVAVMVLVLLCEGGMQHLSWAPIFWLESLAIWAFGLSWIIKGEVMWRDPREAD